MLSEGEGRQKELERAVIKGVEEGPRRELEWV
jgi:hypothetical protein